MAISAIYTANFDRFNDAIQKAEVRVRSFETGTKNAARDVSRLADSFSGAKIQAEAAKSARAIESIGGVTKLTDNELRRLAPTLDESMAKFERMGQVAPESIRKLHTEVKEAIAQSDRLAKATADSTNTANAAATAQTSLTKSIAGWAAGYVTGEVALRLATSGFRALTEFVSSSIESYASAEAATKKLTTALQAQGIASPIVADQYAKLGTRFQQTTVYSDDLITEMQALLVQVGDVMPSQMESALTAATDLASGLGIDLQQATMLVGKAMAGETGTLKRYGITVDEAALKTQGATAVIEAINAQFGGQAQAQLDTYSGKVASLGNAWDNVKESIGGAIVESPLLNAALRAIQTNVVKTGDVAADAKLRLSDIIPPLGAGSGQFLRFLEDAADGMNEVARAQAQLERMPRPELFKPSGWLPDANVVKQALDDGIKRTEALEAAQKKAKEAAEAHARAIKSQADAWRGVDQATKLDQMVAAWSRLSEVERLNQDVIDRVVKDYGALRQHFAAHELPADLERFYQAHLPVIRGVQELKDVTDRYVTATLPDLSRRTLEVRNMLADLTSDGLIPTSRAFTDLFDKMQIPDASKGVRVVRDDLVVTHARTTDLTAGLDDLARSFSQLAQIRPLEGWIAEVAEFINLLNVASQAGGQLGAIFTKQTKDLAGNVTTSFSLDAFRNQQGQMTAGSVAAGGLQAFQSGVAAYGAINQATDVAGRGNRAARGALAGASIGANPGLIAATGGLSILAGAGIGALVGALRNPGFEKEMKRVAHGFSVDISEKLARDIDKLRKQFNNSRQAAEVFSLDRIVAEGGGVKDSNVEKLTGKLRETFSFLERGEFTVEETRGILDRSFGMFAEHVLQSKSLAEKSFQDLFELNKRFGTQSEAIRQFVENQTAALGQGAANLAGPVVAQWGGIAAGIAEAQKTIDAATAAGRTNTDEYSQAVAQLALLEEKRRVGAVAAAEEIEDLGVVTLASFNAGIAAGMDYVTLVHNIGPGLDEIIGLQKDLGIVSENTALQDLANFRARVNANASLVTATRGLGEQMRALASIGGLNADALAAMERQGLRTYDRLRAAEFTERESLKQMEDFLLNVVEAHHQLGTPIDANTQKLIDQAREMGFLKGGAKDATQVMDLGFTKVVGSLGLVAKGLGVDIPDAVQDAIDSLSNVPKSVDNITNAIDRIPTDIDIRARVSYDDPGYQFAVEPRNSFAGGTNGLRYFDPAGELAMLHGWEAVVPEDDWRAMMRDMQMPDMAAVGGGRGGNTVIVKMDNRGALLGDYASQQKLKELVSDAFMNALEQRTQLGTAGYR